MQGRLLIALVVVCFSYSPKAQNRIYAQKMIDTLTSEAFYGRGYVKDGDKIAANFLATNFQKQGIQSFKKDQWLYPFSFNVNSFPGKCDVKIGKKTLKPGIDYIVYPGCPSVKGKFKIQDQNVLKDKHISSGRTAWVFDTSYKQDKNNPLNFSASDFEIQLQKKLTWSVAMRQDELPGIDILKTSFPSGAKKLTVNIETRLFRHEAFNVIGYIPGTEVKDTFIVLTAHYDHLGMMGKTIFPGANDNASGVAMMLDLANYFSKNPPKYSIAFMAFAGEEPGLVGSKAYTGNPWDELPLGKMKFLVNLDLMGSGEKGMAVVNATIFTDYYAKLQEANNAHNYLPAFKMRGKAANSDHYWFVERDVKGFFFYLMGSYSNYHDVQDNSNNLKLGEYYDKSFLLIRDFIKSI
jgi:hypothetical protein